jgi:hypothetical protein
MAIAAAQSKRQAKDAGEYEVYTEVAKALAAGDFSKALADLGSWGQKYPQSDLSSNRLMFYVQAYAGSKQPAKAVDTAAGLLAGDLDAATGGGADALKLLYTVAAAIQEVAKPSPEELATGEKAGRTLLAYDRKPEGLADDAWTQVRGQLRTAANAAILHVALVRAAQSIDAKDCAPAEIALRRVMEEFPDSAQAAWYLGSAALCQYKSLPEKAGLGIYEIARAAALDPAKGMVDQKWQQAVVAPYLEQVYDRYHGPDPSGLKQLKDTAAGSPFPPAGFHIASITEIAQAKQEEFEKTNPQLALWMKIKGALADAGGEQYFANELKDAALPALRGVLVSAKPACRPTELLVAVPLPDAPQPPAAEIALKLDKPMAGAPEAQTGIQWTGVPQAFSASPFLLTMDAESAHIEGLKVSPCRPAPPARMPPAKK